MLMSLAAEENKNSPDENQSRKTSFSKLELKRLDSDIDR
jgi:hypothetical protein